MRSALSLTIILLFFSSLLANVKISEYKASPETDRVVLTWSTKSESNIKKFKILRSNDDRAYIEIAEVNATGPGTEYRYVDENVMFKSSALFYKIRAVDLNNNIIEETNSLPVHPNISGMFRTWGAIKAMFR